MSLVDKVYEFLKEAGQATLNDIYNALPNHSKSSIRGNINRHILKSENAKIKRVGRAIYTVSEIKVVPCNDSLEVIETKTTKIIKFSIIKKITKLSVDKKDYEVNPLVCSLVSGDSTIVDLMEYKDTNYTDTRRHLSLVGATRKDKGNARECNDFYPTPKNVINDILIREKLEGSIYEPAAGDGAICEVLKEYYPDTEIYASDLIYRGYPCKCGIDFLKDSVVETVDNIITNPPFKIATKFIAKAISMAKKKIIMLLKIQALEGIDRYLNLFKNNCLKKVYVYVKRVSFSSCGVKLKNASTMCFAWFVWDKEYKGEPVLDWIY